MKKDVPAQAKKHAMENKNVCASFVVIKGGKYIPAQAKKHAVENKSVCASFVVIN